MYSLHDISLSFGDRLILDRITLHLSPGEVNALIGKNGSGKTTLLRIAAGELLADSGRITNQYERIGYLPQHLESSQTVDDFLGNLPTNRTYEAFRVVELAEVDPDRPVHTLSGGQKTKLGLARLLLEDPTVLLLDEPTNNLDVQGLEWLTDFVQHFSGAILLTSHDRTFLDAIATRTVELSGGNLTLYGGNYSFVRTQQAQTRDAYHARFEAQEGYRRQLLVDIANTKSQAAGVEQTTIQVNTRRYAKKVARKAVVRQARLERQMSKTDWLEKPRDAETYYLPLAETLVPASKVVVEVREVGKHLGEHPVLEDISFQLVGNQRVWLTGSNGSGKSTLLRLIHGTLEPDMGQVKIGPGIRVGFLSQDTSELNLQQTGRDELLSSNEPPTRCMQYARALGLSISDLGQLVRNLSRGQRAKLALAKILLGDPQLLILDEPTNHVELEAREAMEHALHNFQGAIVVASHDRAFVQALGIDHEIAL